MIEEATSDLLEHLQDIEERLQSLDQHGGPVQRSDTFNLRDTREERESITNDLMSVQWPPNWHTEPAQISLGRDIFRNGCFRG